MHIIKTDEADRAEVVSAPCFAVGFAHGGRNARAPPAIGCYKVLYRLEYSCDHLTS